MENRPGSAPDESGCSSRCPTADQSLAAIHRISRRALRVCCFPSPFGSLVGPAPLSGWMPELRWFPFAFDDANLVAQLGGLFIILPLHSLVQLLAETDQVGLPVGAALATLGTLADMLRRTVNVRNQWIKFL